ncbi:MAG: hypothetical protein ACREHG_09950, partial [Candidatus Saccharimonadales bacterium]
YQWLLSVIISSPWVDILLMGISQFLQNSIPAEALGWVRKSGGESFNLAFHRYFFKIKRIPKKKFSSS